MNFYVLTARWMITKAKKKKLFLMVKVGIVSLKIDKVVFCHLLLVCMYVRLPGVKPLCFTSVKGHTSVFVTN